jgi:2-polyprenyl-3-methyl-5-hydroxy-6-metoxy-1,4-benzoquinol methylase
MMKFYAEGDYMDDVSKRRRRGSFGERNRAIRIITILLNLTNINIPKRALDVGCAQGHLLARIEDWAYNVETVGYDLYKDPDAIREVITDKDKITGTFDFISCIHTLEHMYDPIAQLKWMNSLLDDGGTMVLELPTERYILLEHPVVFSVKSVSVMMAIIGIKNFTTIHSDATESVMVFAKKG